MGTLNARQERFCREYAASMNATKAAAAAGYSERTAYAIGQRLLKKVEIASRIAALQAESCERLAVTADTVVSMLLESYRDAKAANQHGPAVRAAELLGKRLGMFRDRVEIDAAQAASDEDLARAIAADDPELATALLNRLRGDRGGSALN